MMPPPMMTTRARSGRSFEVASGFTSAFSHVRPPTRRGLRNRRALVRQCANRSLVSLLHAIRDGDVDAPGLYSLAPQIRCDSAGAFGAEFEIVVREGRTLDVPDDQRGSTPTETDRTLPVNVPSAFDITVPRNRGVLMMYT